jgi:hypothetical protein
MIVVNPYHVIVFNVLRDSARKESVGFGVGFPGVFVECYVVRMVVKQRPEDRVCNRSVGK